MWETDWKYKGQKSLFLLLKNRLLKSHKDAHNPGKERENLRAPDKNER